MKTYDKDIRSFLYDKIKDEYKNEPDTIIVDELNLCQGDARIDIAVINGQFHGYEIKSDSDTLDRLLNQINVYNHVMDTITIVTGESHFDNVIELVPHWWGVVIAEKDKNEDIYFINARYPQTNPDIDPISVAQLLWRNEALNILRKIGKEKGYLSKPKNIIWEKLATCLSLDELQSYVRKELKNRKGWRAGLLQGIGDG